MSVDIDEAGRHDLALGVDHTFGTVSPVFLNGGDAPVTNGDIGALRGRPGAVHHHATLDENIVHDFAPHVIPAKAGIQSGTIQPSGFPPSRE